MTHATTRLTDLVGIRHPIVLGPFGGLSSVELTATVSELGGLPRTTARFRRPSRVTMGGWMTLERPRMPTHGPNRSRME